MAYIDTKYLGKCETCRHHSNSGCNTFCDCGECYSPNMFNIPTADVVEVVRCKDCVYCRPYNDGKLYCHKKADIFVPIVDAHDYCSYGERREE